MAKVNSLYLGNSNVEKMYLGTDIVYERGGTIEYVATLPVASEYKNKVFRLTTDNNLYQSVEIDTNVWDWKALTNDWAVGSTYRFYYDEGTYDLQGWLNGILSNCATDEFTFVCDKIIELGGTSDTKILFSIAKWDGGWITDVIGVDINGWQNSMSSGEFNDIVAEQLSNKDANYDSHIYKYITNIMVVTDDSWKISDLPLELFYYAINIQFPINSALHPEYIEMYPQKND